MSYLHGRNRFQEMFEQAEIQTYHFNTLQLYNTQLKLSSKRAEIKFKYL